MYCTLKFKFDSIYEKRQCNKVYNKLKKQKLYDKAFKNAKAAYHVAKKHAKLTFDCLAERW